MTEQQPRPGPKKRTQDLLTWEAERMADYPYGCKTVLKYPRPDKLTLPYHLIRTPFTEFGYASWRFRQQKDLDDFKSRFSDYLIEDAAQ